MLVKEHTTFTDLCVADFGLAPTDQDSHVPQIFMITKLPKPTKAAASSTEPGLPSGSEPTTAVVVVEEEEEEEMTTIATRRLHTRSDKGKRADYTRQRANRRVKRVAEAKAKAVAKCTPSNPNRTTQSKSKGFGHGKK